MAMHSVILDKATIPPTSDAVDKYVETQYPNLPVPYINSQLDVQPVESIEQKRPRSREEIQAILNELKTMFVGQPSLEDEYFRDKAIEREKERKRDLERC